MKKKHTSMHLRSNVYFTFGHFVASDRCSGNYPNGDPRRNGCVIVGPFVSAAWPLYWSYELQK